MFVDYYTISRTSSHSGGQWGNPEWRSPGTGRTRAQTTNLLTEGVVGHYGQLTGYSHGLARLKIGQRYLKPGCRNRII